MVGIELALLKTLVSFMFEQYLYSTQEYDIDNAPSWYYQEKSSEMCAFTYQTGDLKSIDIAKANAHKQMQKKIKKVIDISIYEQYKNTLTKDESKVLKRFAKDENLGIFVDSKLKYIKVKYEDDINTSFVKACIPKQTIINYQTDRFKTVQNELQDFRFDNDMDDLEKELQED